MLTNLIKYNGLKSLFKQTFFQWKVVLNKNHSNDWHCQLVINCFYLARIFPEMNLEQGVNNPVIKKDSKISHVQACVFKLSFKQNCEIMYYGC